MPTLTHAVWRYRLDKINALMDDMAVDAALPISRSSHGARVRAAGSGDLKPAEALAASW